MDSEQAELFAVFLAESEENLATMEQALLELENEPEHGEHVDVVFRAAHTLKGNSSSLGLNALAEFAHEVESLLDRVRSGALQAEGDLITLLLSAVDAMKRWLPSLRLGSELTMDAFQFAVYQRMNGFASDEMSSPAETAARPKERGSVPEAGGDTARTIRLDAHRMDNLLDLAGEITIAAERVRRKIEALDDAHRRDILDSVEEHDRLLRDLHDTVMRCRMVPIGPTFRRHQRTVRDLANATGKQVRLIIDGADSEIDMTVVEALTDPLVHMIRNAIDHGIEMPQVRQQNGKDPVGTVRLSAHHERGTIVIQVMDDGAGVRLDRVRAKAEALGLPANLFSDAELLNLVFEPGFSTAESVTETSGRGVGMDVVRRNIDRVRGQIHLESEEGAGTTVWIRLPLTLAVIPGFVVGVDGEQYVLPLSVVDECLELPDATSASASGVLHVRGEVVPFVRLKQFFGFAGSSEGKEVAVIVEHHQRRAALIVDEVFGESQIVIKPLTAMLKTISGVTGTAVMGTGAVALVLDPAIIFREFEKNMAEVA